MQVDQIVAIDVATGGVSWDFVQWRINTQQIYHFSSDSEDAITTLAFVRSPVIGCMRMSQVPMVKNTPTVDLMVRRTWTASCTMCQLVMILHSNPIALPILILHSSIMYQLQVQPCRLLEEAPRLVCLYHSLRIPPVDHQGDWRIATGPQQIWGKLWQLSTTTFLSRQRPVCFTYRWRAYAIISLEEPLGGEEVAKEC